MKREGEAEEGAYEIEQTSTYIRLRVPALGPVQLQVELGGDERQHVLCGWVWVVRWTSEGGRAALYDEQAR